MPFWKLKIWHTKVNAPNWLYLHAPAEKKNLGCLMHESSTNQCHPCCLFWRPFLMAMTHCQSMQYSQVFVCCVKDFNQNRCIHTSSHLWSWGPKGPPPAALRSHDRKAVTYASEAPGMWYTFPTGLLPSPAPMMHHTVIMQSTKEVTSHTKA